MTTPKLSENWLSVTSAMFFSSAQSQISSDSRERRNRHPPSAEKHTFMQREEIMVAVISRNVLVLFSTKPNPEFLRIASHSPLSRL